MGVSQTRKIWGEILYMTHSSENVLGAIYLYLIYLIFFSIYLISYLESIDLNVWMILSIIYICI